MSLIDHPYVRLPKRGPLLEVPRRRRLIVFGGGIETGGALFGKMQVLPRVNSHLGANSLEQACGFVPGADTSRRSALSFPPLRHRLVAFGTSWSFRV